MLLDFTITPARLIDMAKDRSGLELQEMAADLGYHKSRITQLKKGTCALTPTEIKYYSEKAGLPFEQTICELELAKNPAAAKVWGRTEHFNGVTSQTPSAPDVRICARHPADRLQTPPKYPRAHAVGKRRNATYRR